MSRVTRREWYRRVNAEWPAVVPPLTAEEAVRALRKLYRFALGRSSIERIRITTGNRRMGRRWNGWYVNPDRGWKYLVHWLSHYCERSGHGGAHARLERRMIREVVRRGWLEGKLKSAPKPPVVRDRRRERYERVLAGIARWQGKARRAQVALRKLERQRRYYEKALAASVRPGPAEGQELAPDGEAQPVARAVRPRAGADAA